MKKLNFWKRIGVILMAIPMFNLAACSAINQKTSNEVCKHLEEKYGCSFTALKIGDRINTSSTTLYICLEDDPNVIFEVKKYDDGTIKDDYVEGLICNEIDKYVESIFAKYNIACTSNAMILEHEAINEDDTSLSIVSFFEKYSLDYYYLCFAVSNENFEEETLTKALTEICENIGVDITFSGYIYDKDKYAECSQAIAETPTFSKYSYESYSPTANVICVLKDGVIERTTFEYYEK
ncbi:MAG: hypothetical protein R3Y35_10170 [Clostridia bacterium]